VAESKGGARKDRHFQRWQMSKKHPDAFINDLSILRGRSEDLYHHNPLSHGAIETNVNNIVGSGLKPHPQLNGEILGLNEDETKELSKNILREFNFVASSQLLDAEKSLNFYEMQKIIFYEMLISGDVFVLMPYITKKSTPYKTTLKIISAEQVQSNDFKIKGGIEVGENGEPLYYHILKEHPNTKAGTIKESIRIKAFDKEDRRLVLHIFKKNEAGQKRGIPYLAPVISAMKLLGDYSDAELTATLISSLYTVFVTTEGGDGLDFEIKDEESKEDKSDYALSAGATVNLKNGEKIEIADPNRPNKNYEIFYRAIVREIGVGLDLPYEILVKHFESSYTAARASFLEAWKYYKRQRALIITQFAQPVYERIIEEGVILGRIKAKGFLEDPFLRHYYLSCRWTGDAQGAIDEIKEVRAAKMRVEEGFSTREQEASIINGSSFSQNIKVAEGESQKMITANLMKKELLLNEDI